jgi:NAD(P)-dependent dehydrogenase (short-subunit alcohol dehydrogenase family)
MSNFTKTDAGRDFALGMQALKRLAQPSDVGGVVAFLASEDTRWITEIPSTRMAAQNSEPKQRYNARAPTGTAG